MEIGKNAAFKTKNVSVVAEVMGQIKKGAQKEINKIPVHHLKNIFFTNTTHILPGYLFIIFYICLLFN